MADKVLLNFSITKLEDMIGKGNVWYTLHYRKYFDRYVVAYLTGRSPQPLEKNGVHLVSLGTGHPVIDVLLSPWRVYKLSKTFHATHFVSADLVLAWWHSWLLRMLSGARVVVMPVCNPVEILQTSGKTYSGLPIWMERACIYLSFLSASRILCFKTNVGGVAWVRSTSFAKKLKVVQLLPEEFSAPEFLEYLDVCEPRGPATETPVQLVFVGRLEKEKLVEDLIEIASVLKELGKTFVLTVVGDGAQRDLLESRAAAAGLGESIVFAGFLPAREVAKCLARSDIFVSPYTGTSVREAAMAGLAIVAYRLGGIDELFSEGENCLLATAGDRRGMARLVADLIDAPRRRREMGAKARSMARGLWSTAALSQSLKDAFDDPEPASHGQ
jgi:glycosyltransferase involved in cell wall biosynthesis